MNEYETQAEKFLQDTGTSFENLGTIVSKPRWAEPGKPWGGECFLIQFKRDDKTYFVDFYGSAHMKTHCIGPTAYDVLSCLTKSDPGSFEEFCGDYGYVTDSRRAYATWEDVKEEWAYVQFMWGDCLEQLQEIN